MRKTKLIVTIIMALSIIMAFTTVKAAAECTMKLSVGESNIKVGDTINVYLSLQSFTEVEGLTAVGGTLEYDSTILEYKSISPENGWSNVQYNQENGIFITTHDNPAGNGNIFKITFEVKAKPENGTEIVRIKNFDVTDDNIEIPTADTAAIITIADKEQTPPPTQPGEDGGNNDQEGNEIGDPSGDQNNDVEDTNIVIDTNTENNKKPNNNNVGDTTTAKEKIPQTGTTEGVIITLVAAIAIVSVITFIKYKNTKIK